VALGFEPTLQGSHACKVGALSTWATLPAVF
jgi:hypothetical protein